MTGKNFATAAQKENFKIKFAELVKNNDQLSNKYTVQFFDTLAKTNYAFSGLDGKSINVLQYLSDTELDSYKSLKNLWQK